MVLSKKIEVFKIVRAKVVRVLATLRCHSSQLCNTVENSQARDCKICEALCGHGELVLLLQHAVMPSCYSCHFQTFSSITSNSGALVLRSLTYEKNGHVLGSHESPYDALSS